jgi:hypothetical protein
MATAKKIPMPLPIDFSTRCGFGIRVVEEMIRGQLMGELSFDGAQGFACEPAIPAERGSSNTVF